MVKVFIDGREGTTGLEINERLASRSGVELITLSDEQRKNPSMRSQCINSSDIVFLCLPDEASRESVSMVSSEKVRIIDASTAHRAEAGWAYGFPELSKDMRAKIAGGNRVAVPGCHASGFLALVYPLIAEGIIGDEYPLSCHSLTGYSGGGKKMIAAYEGESRSDSYSSPRQYALNQEHKHLKEMQLVAGLKSKPIFIPVVCDFYRGMNVAVPLYSKLLNKKLSAEDISAILSDYYSGQKLVQVMPFQHGIEGGMLAANLMAGKNGMQIYISGNSERIVLNALFDNLGKGASGAAVQCMNIMLGMPDDYQL